LADYCYLCSLKQKMKPEELIKKYYVEGSRQYKILTVHSRSVVDFALAIARNRPDLHLDLQFVEEAAMLHDIGIFLTDAPDIDCFGQHPYICHGYLGSELLQREGFPRHALVCERHTGSGISLDEIISSNMPLPHRDMLPQSPEERLICFADKFFSKSHLDRIKPLEKIRKSLAKYGEESLKRFDEMTEEFGIPNDKIKNDIKKQK
jgi:uncharacterized protein